MSHISPAKITILGQQYQIACMPEELTALTQSAQLLDSRLKQIREEKRLPLDQTAIMTALNLAHELLDIKTKYEALQEQTQKNIQSLRDKINAVL